MARSPLGTLTVISLLLVGGSIATLPGLGTGQEFPTGNESNTTSTDPESRAQLDRLQPEAANETGTNQTENATTDSGSSGIDPVGTIEGAWNGATPDIPTTDEIANGTAAWAEEHLLNATQGLLDVSLQFVVGTAHPENSGAYGIFGTPTNEPYEQLYETVYGPYSFQYSVVILILLLLGMVIVLPYAGIVNGGSYRVVQVVGRILAALVFIVFWWPFGTALTQFFDAIALGIGPSPEELTTSMKGLFKLSLGPILAAVSLYLIEWVEILALAFIYAFRQAALIVFQFAMPLVLIFAYAGPHRRVRSIASTIAWQYFALLAMTIPTAFFMRIGFEVGWGFGFGPIGNAIISMSLLALSLITPILFSIAAFRAPPSVQTLAAGAGGAIVGAGAAAHSRIREEDTDEPTSRSAYTATPTYVNAVRERIVVLGGGLGGTEPQAQTVPSTVNPTPPALPSGPGAVSSVSPSPAGAAPSTAAQVREYERTTRRSPSGPATDRARQSPVERTMPQRRPTPAREVIDVPSRPVSPDSTDDHEEESDRR